MLIKTSKKKRRDFIRKSFQSFLGEEILARHSCAEEKALAARETMGVRRIPLTFRKRNLVRYNKRGSVGALGNDYCCARDL
jgi:hypothetical protein